MREPSRRGRRRRRPADKEPGGPPCIGEQQNTSELLLCCYLFFLSHGIVIGFVVVDDEDYPTPTATSGASRAHLGGEQKIVGVLKAMEKNLAELKEEQGMMQAHMEQLGAEKLVEAEQANDAEAKLSSVSDQLATVGTQLALVSEEKNGKTLSLVACRSLLYFCCNDRYFCRCRAGN